MLSHVFFLLPRTVNSLPRRWQAERSHFAMKCSDVAQYGSFLHVPFRSW